MINLNTSHVEVQPIKDTLKTVWDANLNTSHVEVQLWLTTYSSSNSYYI